MSDPVATAPASPGRNPRDAHPAALRGELLAAWEELRRQRRAAESKGVIAGGDLAAAEARYDKLARRYAAARISDGLGPDPEVLDRETFDSVLAEMTNPERFAKRIPETKASALSPETRAAVLASGIKVAELLRALSAPSSFHDVFDQATPLRKLIRQWAGGTISDPFIHRRLIDVSKSQVQFERATADIDLLLHNLRIRYEAERDPSIGPAERLTVERDAGGGLNIVATVSWESLARAFPVEVDDVYASVATAEIAAERIDRAADEVNRELGRFFAELVPMSFALLSRLPRRNRRERTGGVRLSPALAARLVEAAQATDFVADPASPVGFERKFLPPRFRLLTTQRGYRRVRELMVGRKKQDDTTVVVRRAALQKQQEA